jgi:hypothetical protein
MKPASLLIACAMLCMSALVNAEEFKCPEGAKDSGYKPGNIVRWCEIERDGHLVYHGPVWRWHQNGQIKSKENYIYGNGEGEWQAWFENGKMSSLGSYRDGGKTGLWKYWDSSGNIKTEVTYNESGNLWIEYYPTGRKKAEGKAIYRSGKIGSWTFWDEAGNEKARCDFGEGLFVLPNDACRVIAEELEPKGFSRPVPKALKTEDGKASLRVDSQIYEFTTPSGWVADVDAGKKDNTPLVFYPSSSTWRGSGPNMYLRVLFKEDKPFKSVVEREKENFQESVAEYQEKQQKLGKSKGGKDYITKVISYKPLVHTDSTFSIVSSNVICETISFLDVSDKVVLMLVLTSQSESQMNESLTSMLTLVSSLHTKSASDLSQ